MRLTEERGRHSGDSSNNIFVVLHKSGGHTKAGGSGKRSSGHGTGGSGGLAGPGGSGESGKPASKYDPKRPRD